MILPKSPFAPTTINMQPILLLSLFSAAASAALSESALKTYVGSLTLTEKFNPVKEAYWTGYPHHRRTPFAVSPDGKSAYIAYLDSSETNVHVQQVDPSTFKAVGDAVTVTGAKEAGGLVAHDDGFAILTNEALPSGTANAPKDDVPVPVLYRYAGGKQSWKTWLGGPTVQSSSGHSASPDLNGDLVYSEAAKKYGAYFVVTAYDGSAAGHFGDSVQYVSDSGTLESIKGATSSGFGCSHNTGIALEAADAPPYASICAEDQGAIWLNTETQYMSGVQISNENVTNGASNEPMGGMSGSYSNLARMVDSDEYVFAWVSKGAKDLTVNDWLGAPYTHSVNRTANRHVALARFSDKKTLIGEEATTTLGGSGDDQVNWITTGTADHSNAHVAAFDGANALVTYEEIASPNCPMVGFGCEGTFTGSYFQLVNKGEKVGDAIKKDDVYVAGDMVTMADGRICWPYVDMAWSLAASAGRSQTAASAISFACISLDGSSAPAGSSSAAPVASSSAAPIAASPSAVPSSSNPSVNDASISATVTGSASQVSATPIASDSALPSLVLVTSGQSTTPPATSAVVPSSSAVAVVPSSSAAPVVPSSSAAPVVPSSSAAPVAPSSSAAPVVPSSPAEPSVPSSSSAPSVPSAPAKPSDSYSPIVPSVPSGSSAPSFPSRPSGVASPTGGRGHRGNRWGSARPSGGFYPGFGFDGARPSAGFGFGQGRPGSYGGKTHDDKWGFGGWGRPTGVADAQKEAAPTAKSTPCTFETKVRPTATPAAY